MNGMRKIYVSVAIDKNGLVDYCGDTNKKAAIEWCKQQAANGRTAKMKCMEKGLFNMCWFVYELTF